jgi:hypothetical protein
MNEPIPVVIGRREDGPLGVEVLRAVGTHDACGDAAVFYIDRAGSLVIPTPACLGYDPETEPESGE